MKWVIAQSGRLITQSSPQACRPTQGFRTDLQAWDQLLPDQGLAWGAVHELLGPPDAGPPLFAALLLAQAAMRDRDRSATGPAGEVWTGVASGADSPSAVVWLDPDRTLYPPAVFARGILPRRLYLLRPPARQMVWAIAESLRCPGVVAVVAAVDRLTRVQARKIQLSAEQGGGVGLLLRPDDARSAIYAASSRWQVEPAPAGRAVLRWRVRLAHGQGGLTGRGFDLELDREADHVRAIDRPADRPAAATTARATA